MHKDTYQDSNPMKYQTAQTGNSNSKNYLKLIHIPNTMIKRVACMVSALKVTKVAGRLFKLILISIQDSSFKQLKQQLICISRTSIDLVNISEMCSMDPYE